MKILFFTPVVATSAIGRMAELVVRQLAIQGHDVTVVQSEDFSCFDSPVHPFEVEVLRWNELDRILSLAATTDAVVYQIGNNYQYHRGCLEWLPKLPGVVCLHDYFLGHLFWGWADQVGRTNAYAVLSAWYGMEVGRSYFSASSTQHFVESTRQTAPLTEWVASMAIGVVVHSGWDIQRVLSACPGPVDVVPLAYNVCVASTADAKHVVPNGKDFSQGRMHLLTIGHVNWNKRVESIVRAVGASDVLRNKVIYQLVGRIEADVRMQLVALAESLNVNLLISGEVDSVTLAQAIQQADVLCCLRLPALESASASTIEAMLYGKPTIVMDTGFYRDLPEDCVCKVSPERELEDLQKTLERLIQNPTERSVLGNRAKQFAETTFSACQYASCLVGLSRRAARGTPVIQATRFFANTLVQWGALGDQLPLCHTLAPLRIFETM